MNSFAEILSRQTTPPPPPPTQWYAAEHPDHPAECHIMYRSTGVSGAQTVHTPTLAEHV